MTIKYPDGTALNALLLSRANDTLRVTVPGDDDVRTFTLIREAWISEKCEPVTIEFAWQRREAVAVTNETECVCSKELASRLISMLLAGTERRRFDREHAVSALNPERPLLKSED